MKEFNLKQCMDKGEWDCFVELSPQGNIFCKSAFLDSLGIKYKLWFVEKNDNPCCAFFILLNNCDAIIAAPFPFSMYQGILLSHEITNKSVNKRTTEEMKLIEFMLSELERKYKIISFCLHHKMEDLRGFSWFHYHQPELGRFDIELKYSGLVELSKANGFENYLKSIRKSRRYEYTKAKKNNYYIEVSDDISILETLYCMTFERQNIKLKQEQIILLKTIAQNALENKFGELLICRNHKDITVGATLFLYDNSYCYYLVGANHPDYRQSGAGTYILLENIRRYMELGYKFLDVCGMNSPNRGDFKLSLNAKPIPYYIVTWQSPTLT